MIRSRNASLGERSAVFLTVGFVATLGFVFVTAGCNGSKKEAEEPGYQPTSSPERQSACPAEWKAAKEAREGMLGNQTESAKRTAGNAVLAQAACERVAMTAGAFAGGTHAKMLAEVTAVGDLARDIRNLYSEVGNYGIAEFRVAAPLGRGLVNLGLSKRLSSIGNPTDMTDDNELAAFRAEVGALVGHFRQEGDRELRDALSLAETAGSLDAASQTSAACDGLRSIGAALPPRC